MKCLNRIAIVAIAILGGIFSASAQSRTSYFMEGSYFRTEMNPALAPTRGYIAFPGMGGVGININNNFLSVDNLLYQRNGEMVTAFNGQVTADEFLGKLPQNCRIGERLNINLLSVGFYTGRMFWNFGASLRSELNVRVPSDIFRLVKNLGNGTFSLGELSVDTNNYFETYLGTSIPIGEHVNIGIRVKYLNGLAFANINLAGSQLTLGEDSVTAKVQANGVVSTPVANSSGLLINKDNFDTLDLGSIINPAFTDFQFGDMSNGFNMKAIFDPVKNVFKQFKSWGLAADLGAEVRLLDDHLRISAAITDLGFMRFNSAQTLSVHNLMGSAYFNGINIDINSEETSEVDFDYNISDGYVSGSDKHYTTMLNFSVNAGVEYNILNNHIAFGLLSHTEFVNKVAFPELTASVNFRATNWLTATVSHTFLNRHAPGVLGFALNLHPRVLNIFIGLDYIDTRFGVYNTEDGLSIPIPRYMNSINAYIGFGFNFARPKWMKNK